MLSFALLKNKENTDVLQLQQAAEPSTLSTDKSRHLHLTAISILDLHRWEPFFVG